MFSEKIDKIIYYLILGMTFVIPLLINPFGYERYEIDKIAIFCVFVEILLALSLIKFSSFKNVWATLKSKKLFSFEWLFALFIGSYIVSTILSISVDDSLWGLVDRRFGFYTIIHVILFFFILKNQKFSIKQIKSVFLSLLFSSVLVSLYAALQKFGFDLLKDAIYITLKTDKTVIRPMGSLGHPNYLGAYLAMLAPVLYYLFLESKKYWQKIFCFLVSLFHFVALYFTLNRGGWLAWTGGSLIFVLLYSILRRPKSRKIIFYINKLVVILVIIGICFSFFTGVWDFSGKKRTADNTLEGGSIYVRLQEYKYAWSLIKEQPILGYGPETYIHNAVLRERDEIEMATDNRYSDRVHNIFLDTAYSLGFLGLILLLLLYLKNTLSSFQVMKSKENNQDLLGIVALSSFTAYLIEVQFHFDTIITSFLLWLLFGVIFSTLKKEKDISKPSVKNLSLPIIIAATLILLFGLFLNINAIYLNTVCDLSCFL